MRISIFLISLLLFMCATDSDNTTTVIDDKPKDSVELPADSSDTTIDSGLVDSLDVDSSDIVEVDTLNLDTIYSFGFDINEAITGAQMFENQAYYFTEYPDVGPSTIGKFCIDFLDTLFNERTFTIIISSDSILIDTLFYVEAYVADTDSLLIVSKIMYQNKRELEFGETEQKIAINERDTASYELNYLPHAITGYLEDGNYPTWYYYFKTKRTYKIKRSELS